MMFWRIDCNNYFLYKMIVNNLIQLGEVAELGQEFSHTIAGFFIGINKTKENITQYFRVILYLFIDIDGLLITADN